MESSLHFKTGFRGYLARKLAELADRADPVEETIMLPSVLSVAAFMLADHNEISALSAAFLMFTVFMLLSGVWFGAVRRLGAFPRAAIRGLFVGALVAAGVYLTSRDVASRQAWARLSVSLIYIATGYVWIGAMFATLLRELVAVTEEDWQRSSPRRDKTRRILQMLLRTRPMDGATEGEAIVVWIIRLVVKIFAAMAAGKAIFGIGPETLWRAVTDFLHFKQ